MTVRLRIDGLKCANCAGIIERRIGESEGIRSVELNFVTSRITIDTDLEPGSVRDIVQSIADNVEPGTHVSIDAGSVNKERRTDRAELVRTMSCAAAFGITIALQLSGTVEEWICSIIFVAIFAIVGIRTIVSAIEGMFRGDIFGEAFLMSIATIGAIVIGEYAEASAVMLFFSIGGLIEGYAINNSKDRISELIELVPRVAHVKRDGDVTDVPPEDVSVNELIVVRPGERIPLDGVVIDGATELDTSTLTGEPIPLPVGVNDRVLSGSINLSGTITMRVSDGFKDSTIARIMTLMTEAGAKKAQSERMITKFARYYTPTICCLALLVAVIPILLGMDPHEWTYKALTFLVISCPCALLISIPMTIMSGIGCASSNGILIKGGSYLEMLSDIDTIAFDKTGTLTKGKFTVTEAISNEPELMIRVAVALESNSNHPLAKAVCERFGNVAVTAYDVEEIPGVGMKGMVDGRPAYVGRGVFAPEQGTEESESASTRIHIIYDNRHLGHIEFNDEVKEGALPALDSLRSLGVRRIEMLTGDAWGVASGIAEELGMDSCNAEMLPDDKLKYIETRLETVDGTLAYVGDGINDGPSLKRADIGISMGQIGSDIAMEASDVIIAGDDLSRIPQAMKISRKTMSIVKQNIALSLGIKAVVLILTTLGLTDMWGAVVADVGACILAILNSLRALRI